MPRGHRARRIAAAAGVGVAALVCAGASPASARSLPSPAVTFVTAHKQPGGGELRRATTTLIDVPTLLRVDAGAGPDLLATVVLLSTSRVTLVIDRLPGASAALPASVEAVARDPTGGSLGRQRIAVGYDARGGRAPRRFRATVLFRVGGDPNHIAVQQAAGGAADGLVTTASLFDPGAGGARLREERIGVGFAPVPSSIRADVTFASPRIDARVTTSQPSAATIDGSLADGDDVSSLRAVVDRLPTAVGVSYGEDADGRPAIACDAADPIGSIRARFEHRAGGRLREAVDAAIAGLPGRLRFALTGASSGMLQASAPVGQIDVAAARNGEPLAVAGSEPGVRAYAREDFASFAVRLRGLQEARVDAAGAIAVDATIAAQRFGVAIDAGGLRVAGTIANLPPHVSLRADVAAGAIDYDSHGATIRTIALRARGRLGGGVRKIAATITRLPAQAHVRFTRARGRPMRFAFDASRPVGAIDVVATGGRAPPRVARDRDVLYLRDVRGDFVVHGRVSGLRRVAFAAPLNGRGPLSVSIRRTSRRPIDVDVRTRVARSARDPLVVKGNLTGLPGATALRVEGRRGLHVAYDASAPLGAIHLSARGGGLPKLARSVRLDVRDLPRRLRIDQARPGAVLTASADRPVGSLSVATAPRGTARPVAGSGSGLRIAGASLAARLRGLRRVVVRTGSPLRLDATLARQRFAVTVDQPTRGLRLTGTIDRLPSRIGLAVDLPRGVVAYDGHGQSIDRIALALTARRALFARARRIGLTITSFPSGARVRLDRRSGSFQFDASRPLGTVDVSATDGAPLPASTGDRVYYRDLPGAYALHARLTGLRHVAYGSRPISVELGRAGGRPIDVDVQTALAGSASPLVLAGRLDGLPRFVRVALRGEGRALAADYDASDRLRGLHLTARGGPLPASARSARLDIDDLPRRVRIRVPGDGTFFADADGGVGSLGVAVAPRGEARPVAGSGSGLRFVAGAGIAVRLRGLRHIALTRQAPLTLEATLARQPLAFTVALPRAGRRLTGTIADLPRNVRLTFATGGTLIDYDGGGERIGRIAFDARGRRPLFGGARHVFGTIAGVPSGRLQLGRGGTTRVRFAASQRIDEVDVTATDGRAAPPAPAGRDLVQYRDAGGRFFAHVRVSGLRRVAFAAPRGGDGPITAAIGRSSALPLDVDVRAVVRRGEAPLVVRGSLAGLPSELTLGLRTAGGVHATYAASGPLRAIALTAKGPPLPGRVELDVRGVPDRLELDVPDSRRPRLASVASGPVQRIALDVRGRKALFGRARRVRATIDDLPERLRLAPGRGGLVFEASRPIGRVRLAASDGCGPAPGGFGDGADGLYYRDLPSRYAVYARLSGLRRIAYAAGPLTIGVARTRARPPGRIGFDVLTQRATAPARGRCPKPDSRAPAQPLRVQGHLDGLPGELQVKVADGPGVHADYRASGVLERLALVIRGLGATGRNVLVHADRVPRRVAFDYEDQRCDRRRCGAFVRTSGGPPVGRATFKLSSGRFLDLTGSKDRLVVVPGREGLGLAARLSNLRYLNAGVIGTPFRLGVGTAGAARQPPFAIEARLANPSKTWTGALGVTLRDIPKDLRVCFDRGPACSESGETDAANSLRFSGDARDGAPPLQIRAIVCFRQVRPADCGGDGSARVVLFVEAQHLGLELLPSERGYAFVNTVPPSGRPPEGLPISGDLGYFSSDEQQVCLRLAAGARFGMRKYLRPPPGTASYGPRGLRSLTFGEGDPALRCDRYRDPDGLVPRSMPREALPTDRFSTRAGD